MRGSFLIRLFICLYSFQIFTSYQANAISGTYDFLSINEDYRSGSKNETLSDASSASFACTGRRIYFRGGGDTTFNASLYPGDTLILNNARGDLGDIIFNYCRGTATCPIIIMNDPAQDSAASFRGKHSRLQFNGCWYIKVLGNGRPDVPYGFYFNHFPGSMNQWGGPDYFPMAFSQRSKCMEIRRCHMEKVSTGIVIKEDPACIDSLTFASGFVMDSIIIDSNRIEKTFNEGMYLGNTLPDNNPEGYIFNDTKRPGVCGNIRRGFARFQASDSTMRFQGNYTNAFQPGAYFRVGGATLGHNNDYNQSWKVKPSGSVYIGDTTIIKVTNIDLIHAGNWMSNENIANASFDTVKFNRPMRIGYLYAAYNILDSTGRGGIQYSSSNQSQSVIEYNTISHCGLTRVAGQGNGISIGAYTNTIVRNNIITTTVAEGIHNTGGGLTNVIQLVESNRIDSSGYCDAYVDPANGNFSWFGIPNDPNNNWVAAIAFRTRGLDSLPALDSTRFHIKANLVGAFTLSKQITWDGKRYGGIVLEDYSQRMQRSGNLICNNRRLDGRRLLNGTDTIVSIQIQAGQLDPVWDTTGCGNALPPNIPPTANAGADKVIQLPTSSVSVNGTGTDPDGSVVGYLWTKIAGPAAYNIVNPVSATTIFNGLSQGNYQFELKVTDNSGATGKDTVNVTVNPAANIQPTANAGPDKAITLPVNTVTITGSGSDPDGTIVSYLWTKIAGPSTFTIVTPGQSQTIINNLIQGVYQFELKVTDNQGAIGRDTVNVTVNPAPNIPPAANAGADQVVALPINFVTLNGSGTDPDGTITGYLWTRVAGPAGCSIINAGAAGTNVTGLVQGTYQFELTVTDNSGAIAKDTMIVTVNPLPNRPPTANAGADQTIQLPVNTVTVTGSGNDPDGTIASYFWTKISGPVNYTIVNPASPSTVINNLVQGVYKFELKVIDNSGAPARDTVQITVLSTGNQPPVANAGVDQNIMLPVSSVRLNGSGTDLDGTITTYQWTKVSGPSTYSIATPAAAITDVINLVQGIYQFVLTVTDNNGASSSDTVNVIVNPSSPLPNIPPTARAGADQSITLPVSYITTSASASDQDGIVANVQWTKLEGPLSYTIVNPTQAQTEVRDLVPGHYSFELKVTDNRGAITRDTMIIDVFDAPLLYGNVFPSPATNKINVSINAAVTSEQTIVTIFDIRGQPMIREAFTRSSQNTVRQYDVTRWAKGYYLVEIKLTDINREVKRFVVQ